MRIYAGVGYAEDIVFYSHAEQDIPYTKEYNLTLSAGLYTVELRTDGKKRWDRNSDAVLRIPSLGIHALYKMSDENLEQTVGVFSFLIHLPMMIKSPHTAAISNDLHIQKKTGEMAADELFRILANKEIVYESPALPVNSLYEVELPLAETDQHNYRLELRSLSGNQWEDGCWIRMTTEYDVEILKTSLMTTSSMKADFSYYTPIPPTSAWRFSNTYHFDWKASRYDDKEWAFIATTSITSLNNPDTTSYIIPGTQYYRKTIRESLFDKGVLNLQFKYQHGIVVYINAVEVFRDNMPYGEVYDDLPSVNSYSTLEYHGIIIPTSVLRNPFTIAVELHFPSTTIPEPMVFDAIVTWYCNDSVNDGMSSFNFEVTADAGVSNYENVLNYHFSNITTYSSSDAPVSLYFSARDNTFPYLGTLHLYQQSKNRSHLPSRIQLFGQDLWKPNQWHQLVDMKYSKNVQSNAFFNLAFSEIGVAYKTYKVTLDACSDETCHASFLFSHAINNFKHFVYPYSPFVFGVDEGGSVGPIHNINPSTATVTLPIQDESITIDRTGVLSGIPKTEVPLTNITIYEIYMNMAAHMPELLFTESFNFTVIPPPSSVEYPNSKFSLQQGAHFSAVPVYRGEYVSFSVECGRLPKGLSIDIKTGEIAGTPEEAVSSKQLTIRMANIAGSVSTSISLTIMGSPTSYHYPKQYYFIPIWKSFSARPDCYGGSITYAIKSGVLPKGLSFDQNTGDITGKATSLQIKTMELVAKNSIGSTTTTIHLITIIPVGLIITILLAIILLILFYVKKYVSNKYSGEEYEQLTKKTKRNTKSKQKRSILEV